MENSSNPSITAIVPAYNEARTIRSVLDELQKIKQVTHIIVVNDGSTDDTNRVVQEYPQVELIEHPYNIGNGASLKTGIRKSESDFVLLLDADGQHPPKEIPILVQYIYKYDMVVGARSSKSEAQWFRRLANFVFNKYSSYVVGEKVHDLTSGFRILRTPIAKQFVPLLPNGFSSPSTLTIACFRSGYTVKYQEFFSPARKGTSKIKLFRDGLRFLMTITRLGVLFSPLRIFLPVSILFVVAGMAYFTIITLSENRFSGFGAMVVTLGIFLFMLGLVSEQIALLRFMKK